MIFPQLFLILAIFGVAVFLSPQTFFFPVVAIIGLTATATKQMQQKIVEAMGMISPFVIDVNPDRKNIYFSSSRRGNQGDEKLVNILDPLLKDPRSRRQDFPLTIYGNLETIANCIIFIPGYCYS